jgi:hypothetical protein
MYRVKSGNGPRRRPRYSYVSIRYLLVSPVYIRQPINRDVFFVKLGVRCSVRAFEFPNCGVVTSFFLLMVIIMSEQYRTPTEPYEHTEDRESEHELYEYDPIDDLRVGMMEALQLVVADNQQRQRSSEEHFRDINRILLSLQRDNEQGKAQIERLLRDNEQLKALVEMHVKAIAGRLHLPSIAVMPLRSPEDTSIDEEELTNDESATELTASSTTVESSVDERVIESPDGQETPVSHETRRVPRAPPNSRSRVYEMDGYEETEALDDSSAHLGHGHSGGVMTEDIDEEAATHESATESTESGVKTVVNPRLQWKSNIDEHVIESPDVQEMAVSHVTMRAPRVPPNSRSRVYEMDDGYEETEALDNSSANLGHGHSGGVMTEDIDKETATHESATESTESGVKTVVNPRLQWDAIESPDVQEVAVSHVTTRRAPPNSRSRVYEMDDGYEETEALDNSSANMGHGHSGGVMTGKSHDSATSFEMWLKENWQTPEPKSKPERKNPFARVLESPRHEIASGSISDQSFELCRVEVPDNRPPRKKKNPWTVSKVIESIAIDSTTPTVSTAARDSNEDGEGKDGDERDSYHGQIARDAPDNDVESEDSNEGDDSSPGEYGSDNAEDEEWYNNDADGLDKDDEARDDGAEVTGSTSESHVASQPSPTPSDNSAPRQSTVCDNDEAFPPVEYDASQRRESRVMVEVCGEDGENKRDEEAAIDEDLNHSQASRSEDSNEDDDGSEHAPSRTFESIPTTTVSPSSSGLISSAVYEDAFANPNPGDPTSRDILCIPTTITIPDNLQTKFTQYRAHQHEGAKRFSEIALIHGKAYHLANRKGAKKIRSDCVKTLKSENRRFLKANSGGTWSEMDDVGCMKKMLEGMKNAVRKIRKAGGISGGDHNLATNH